MRTGLPREPRTRSADRAFRHIAILKPQTTELGGFILIQGTQEQIDSLRRDEDFQATDLYEQALRNAGLSP